MDNKKLWERLNNWVEEGPSETPEVEEEASFGVKDTETIQEEIREKYAPPPKETRYKNKSFLQRIDEWENAHGIAFFRRFYNAMSVVVCCVIIVIFLITVSYLPPFGNPDNPANNEVVAKYIEDALEDTGATNVVAGMILDYRAFDTFGEASVLFIASCCIMILLRREGGPKQGDPMVEEMNEPRHDTILTKVSMLIIPIVLIFGIYVVLNGHISPGGGFSGGTILGTAMILYLSAFGAKQVSRFFTQKTYKWMTFSALTFYAVAKSYSFYTGANHIESIIPLGTPGAILSGGLILPLNICVGLVVACTMYGFYTLFSKGEI